MPLREAITFLKGSVDKTSHGGAPAVYPFHEGFVYAESQATLASYPVPHMMGTFGLAADDLEGAVERMADEPVVSAGEGTLILRSGRRRSTIDLFPADPPMMDDFANVEWIPLPNGLWQALKAALPFASRDGTWQKSICLSTGRLLALSGPSAAEIELPSLELTAQLSLRADAVDYLVDLPVPERWSIREDRAVYFGWTVGAWVRVRQESVPWPVNDEGKTLVDNVLTAAEADSASTVPITDVWRGEFVDIAGLAKFGDGDVIVTPDSLYGKSRHGEHRAEFPTGAARETRWGIKTMIPIVAAAAEWKPDAKQVALWRGDKIRGAVAGRAR